MVRDRARHSPRRARRSAFAVMIRTGGQWGQRGQPYTTRLSAVPTYRATPGTAGTTRPFISLREQWEQRERPPASKGFRLFPVTCARREQREQGCPRFQKTHLGTRQNRQNPESGYLMSVRVPLPAAADARDRAAKQKAREAFA